MNRKILGFPLGVILAAAVMWMPAPEGLSPEAKRAGAIALLMAVWWITECLPIAATSLVPLALYPVFSIMNASETAKRYADPNIFLFMGGFMLALSMQKWNLHKRIALHVIYFVGGGLRRMLGGFMFAAAMISMWVSNTATAIMMLPIAMAVIGQLDLGGSEKGKKSFASALMLGIAYASSIGGVATLIGTPPNMIFVGQAKALLPSLPEIGFIQWFLLGFPLALGFLLISWAYLAFLLIPREKKAETNRRIIRDQIRSLGPCSRGELATMVIFTFTVLAWITRENIVIGRFVARGWMEALHLKGVHDGTVAMIAALILFLTPIDLKKGEFLLDWEWAKKLPWEILLLFGGGFALAESFQVTGLAAWLGGGFSVFHTMPPFWLIFILCLTTTFSSELMSNTAQATMMMPVLAAAAVTLGIHPYLLMIPATIACSLAFMMPVGTPPNAIAFGSGHLTMPQMAKAGFVLNILGSIWITLMVYFLAPAIFGISLSVR